MNPTQWWDERALPVLVDLALGESTSGPWRATACADLVGDVLEVGFGSGRNLPHYPATVCRVLAVEPADRSWARARDRITAFEGSPGACPDRRVERIGLDGARLPVPDGSVDAVVSTWTLCTIPEITGALGEARRVLRPGGELRFVEHTRASRPGVARFQEGIQPAWGRLAGGCHLDRDILGLLDACGFEVTPGRSSSAGALELAPFVSGRARVRT